MKGDSIRILIVDDHQLFRNAVAVLFGQSERAEIVGSVSSAEEAIDIFPSLNPHIILMDIFMGGMSGIEATRCIRERDPDIKIILISGTVTKELITAGIEAGIDGYLSKDIDADTLMLAVEAVAGGRRFFHQSATELLLDDLFIRKNGSSKTPKTKDLTTREEEVLALIASGKRNRQVADALTISIKTVESHKANILSKLGLKTTTELVHYAIRNNLIALD